MPGRFKSDHLIVYSLIVIGYLIHWIHNDLEYYPGRFETSLLNNVWQVVYIVAINLLYFDFVLPVVTSRKTNRVIAVVSSVVIHLIVFAFGLFAWRMLGIMIGIYTPLKGYTNAFQVLSDSIRFAPGPFLVFAVFKLFYDYTRLKYEGQQARLEKKQAELLFLKSQINPHFLFNTLNNIYSLSQYQPQLVSESVLRLSKILRYLLYEADQELITVEKEIKIITDYIDLEKLRYSESVAINFHYEIENFSEMIPPLLLMPLVENAFKHGVSVSRGERFVDVRFSLKGKQLNFLVKNSTPMVAMDTEMKGNIGLSNLRRRLSLLYRDFELITEQKESTFIALLKISVSSHV